MSNLEVKRDAVSFVDYKIRQRKVMLFSKKFSAECKMVKHILETYKMAPNSYEVCEIECRQDCTQIENYFLIICLTNSREVPQLFIGGKYVGGFKDIVRLHLSGDLWTLLSAAHALPPNSVAPTAEQISNARDGFPEPLVFPVSTASAS